PGRRAPAGISGAAAQGPGRRAMDSPRGERAARHRRQPGPGDDVRQSLALALAVAGVVGCSGLEATEAGVVGIEVRVPGPDTLEVGESIQLSALALDKNGDSVAAAITWECPDPAATIGETTGVLTGVSVGNARVQANEGSLGSSFITFAVIAPADTLAIS